MNIHMISMTPDEFSARVAAIRNADLEGRHEESDLLAAETLRLLGFAAGAENTHD